jgi:hypothetical protein
MTGTFESSGAGCTHDGSAGGAACDIVTGGRAEFLIGVQLLGADVDQGDKVEVRVIGASGVPFGAYTAVPTVTVSNIYTIPQVTLTAGVSGERVSPPIPTAATGYKLTFQQHGWPHAGGAAVKVYLDASYDGTQSWVNLTEDTLPDEAVPAYRDIPQDAFRVTASLDPETGGVKRRLRLRWEPAKTVDVSGTVVSYTPSA